MTDEYRFRASPSLTENWQHFRFAVADGVATVTLDRPEKLNPLTFESYADLRDLLAELPHHTDVRVLVIRGEGKGFCGGGDVNEIIGELIKMEPRDLIRFTKMTGDVIRAMRECPVPIIAAVHGIAAGAGAVIALAADFRVVSASGRFAFLFTKVGLSGGDMGAAYLLPRVVGLGRATELLMLGGVIDAATADRYGLVSRLVGGRRDRRGRRGAGAHAGRRADAGAGADQGAADQGAGHAAGRGDGARRDDPGAADDHEGPRGVPRGVQREAAAAVAGPLR